MSAWFGDCGVEKRGSSPSTLSNAFITDRVTDQSCLFSDQLRDPPGTPRFKRRVLDLLRHYTRRVVDWPRRALQSHSRRSITFVPLISTLTDQMAAPHFETRNCRPSCLFHSPKCKLLSSQATRSKPPQQHKLTYG